MLPSYKRRASSSSTFVLFVKHFWRILIWRLLCDVVVVVSCFFLWEKTMDHEVEG